MAELYVGRLARGVALAAGALLASVASAETVSGVPRVVDGDSLAFGTVAVRLHGIDAPESGQNCGSTACGAMATAALTRLAADGLTCALRERDRYRRFIGICHAGTTNIAATLVQAGHAVAYTRYSEAYLPQQRQAKAVGLGIWTEPFIAPEDWRRGQRSEPAARDACAIKGNISRNGTQIYHMRGSRSYTATRISEGKGEQWFCTETAARRAGWRAPLR